MNFKEIYIGQIIETAVKEREIEISRIVNFLKCTEEDILKTYKSRIVDTETLLRWSKLLEYDFFRLYSQHLILYAPPTKTNIIEKKKNNLPQFRKNIYTMEVIDFILEQIRSGRLSKTEVIGRYKIPRTTLHKWIMKYKDNNE